MSNALVQYRFRIYSTDDTAVETTFQAELQGWDAVGGQEVRALEGRAETRPWSISVVDYSTAVTNDLADSSGRMRRLGRLCDFQQNLDSSGWATLATGRISDIFLGDDVASYRFVMEDEHYKARHALIFNSTSHDPTCYVYPPGLRSDWMGLRARQTGGARIYLRRGNLSLVLFDSTASVSALAMRELEQDLLDSTAQGYAASSTQGNFKFLRFHGDGSDYEVCALGSGDAETGVVDLVPLVRLPPEDQVRVPTWVVDPSTALGTSGDRIDSAYLYSPGASPSPGQPWHIGGAAGVSPFTVLRDIYDSSYGGQSLRYDSTAFTNLISNRLIPPVAFRITSPRGMAEFTERTIYGAFGAVGFVNRDGRIMPRTLFMPSTNDVDQTALTELTGANLRAPHPSWQHTRQELVTVIDLPAYTVSKLSDREVRARAYDVAADFVSINGYLAGRAEFTGRLFEFGPVPISHATPIEHDRMSIGRITHRIENEAITLDWSWRQAMAREMFARFGDGPIQGQLYTLSSGTSGILPGDFAKVTLGTYPNMGIQGRGNTRIVQILSAMDTPYGPVFDYLDAGPNQSPLTGPTITPSSSTEGRPANHHEINVTISGTPADGWTILQVGDDTASTGVPAADSTRWTFGNSLNVVNTSGFYKVTALPNSGNWWVRAKNLKAGYWSSPWTYSTGRVPNGALVAPSGVATTNVSAVSADVSWTNSTASTGYPIEVAKLAIGAGTTWQAVATLPPGSNRYRLDGLSSATTSYSAAVRYYDPYGGFSGQAASTVFSSTGQPTAGTITTLQLMFGDDTTEERY